MWLRPAKKWIDSAEKLREHPVLASLRDGVMWSLLPAGVAMVPLYFLLAGERDWGLRAMDVYLASLGVMGPSCALLIGQFLAKYYKIKCYPGGVALAVYLSLLPHWPHNLNGIVELLRDTFTSGPFVGFFLAITLGGGVIWLRMRRPAMKYGAEALGLLAGFFLIAFFRWYNLDIHRIIRVGIGRHVSTADALSAGIFIVSAINLLWFFGFQGSAIIGSFITGVYAQLAYENMFAARHGAMPPHLITLAFLNYVFIGGAGTSLLLPFFMIFSKSKRLRWLGGISILPVLFNVNETLIYLLPLVLNTELAIPYFFGPIFVVVSTFYSIHWGLMPNFSYYIPGIYYLPSPIMGIVATTPGFALPHSIEGLRRIFMLVLQSQSWRSGVVAIVQICALAIFYYPFYKAYERKVLEEETRKAETGALSSHVPSTQWSHGSVPT